MSFNKGTGRKIIDGAGGIAYVIIALIMLASTGFLYHVPAQVGANRPMNLGGEEVRVHLGGEGAAEGREAGKEYAAGSMEGNVPFRPVFQGYENDPPPPVVEIKPISLRLTIPCTGTFEPGGELDLLLDVKTGTQPQKVDVYFVMLHPSYRLYSAWNWEASLAPASAAVTLPPGLDVRNLSIFTKKLPSELPPILDFGRYTFAVAAFNAGTSNLASNIATADFMMN